MTWVSRAKGHTARSFALVAILFAAGTVAGFGRDLLVIRSVGYGVDSDRFFTLVVPVVAFWGLTTQGLLLPVSLLAGRHERVVRWTLLLAFCIPVLGYLFTTDSAGDRVASVLLLASFTASSFTSRLLPRLVAGGAVEKLGYAPLLANIVTAIAALLGADVQVLIASYCAGLPLSFALVCRHFGRPPAAPRVHDVAVTSTTVALYFASGVLFQSYPVLERIIGETFSAGVNTDLALASKVASLPIGLFGFALGTAAFARIRRGGAEAHSDLLMQLMRRRAIAVIAGATALAVIAAYAVSPVVSAAAGGGDLERLPVYSAAYCLATPIISVGTIAIAESQAHVRLREVARLYATFLVAYVAAAGVAYVWKQPLLLVLGTAFGYCLVIRRARSSQRKDVQCGSQSSMTT